MNLDETFWDNRYQSFDTGWDLGDVSPPLKAYFDQLTNKAIRILVPGGGNSYEAEYLHEQGFTNVYVIDVSATALKNFSERVPDFPKERLIHANFFDLDMTFDLIIEQTFFCALDPNLRDRYVAKIHSLLDTNGKLVGLLFDAPLYSDRPPFGGTKLEYENRFKIYFNIVRITPSYNSHESRHGKEVFISVMKTK
ncbi:methyltransferase domain-containing protein [Psychroserpens sp.]|uniref:methyltransferase domain-containing protein n=1 Tax=Psychroserpens sp. TaxID=2020870 RepID=UPI001B0DB91C|nr:methyltransferase domain-containing protein [Psychroserpens sp.]MBO6607361.1 methyltransferase domain-containing protein [Psychroserpens sp.]MBO6632596.1 methyltransferase domain-containing protein [Psychroserpens sp.]MBO6654563.1 methyltransferase domain-containing protein [Psychroserpens sp.]MBO6681090.1 methyltransferase domain-containing protein [Psychroserpens sp.]MBO6749955.1 methyltransferase domain-containing protein [Psychroserpens sp.]